MDDSIREFLTMVRKIPNFGELIEYKSSEDTYDTMSCMQNADVCLG